MNYRLWVSKDGTTLMRMWDNGQVEVATRPDPGATWGPPTNLVEEQVH